MNNNFKFEVSVIIPVYNAAAFVNQAVESALMQPETAEVILIEDGSPDNSLEVCQSLVERLDSVHLLRHPGGKNLGAGASRNLGMRAAQYEYIAFLDADDFYLPGRFVKAKEIFTQDQDCGGVYEAIGTYIEDEISMQRWRESDEMQGELITMNKIVPPEELLEKLVLSLAGYFLTNGLVIKRSLLNLTGYMDESLILHQDNDFMYRCAAVSRLLPGRLDEPVAMRRVHAQNRITAPRSQKQKIKDRMKMWKVTYRWFRVNTNREKRNLISKAIVKFWTKKYSETNNTQSYFSREILKRISLTFLPFSLPEIVSEPNYWISFLPSRVKLKIN